MSTVCYPEGLYFHARLEILLGNDRKKARTENTTRVLHNVKNNPRMKEIL